MRLHPVQGAMHFGAASGAMLVAYAICEGLNEVMGAAGPAIPHPHAIFVPHGVVVVIAWMYGWAAMPLLYPAALISAWLIFGAMVLDPLILALLAAKLAAVPLAFDLFRMAGQDARGMGTAANWKMLVAVGLLGSVLGNVPRVVFGPCCGEMTVMEQVATFGNAVAGDIAGLVFVLLVVMLFFRALRHG